jgi:hypothetical protein
VELISRESKIRTTVICRTRYRLYSTNKLVLLLLKTCHQAIIAVDASEASTFPIQRKGEPISEDDTVFGDGDFSLKHNLIDNWILLD